MPRATRYLMEGYIYHLTHRCHDRRFLLKFKRERDAYREWLRIGTQRYGVPVLGYCITCNHVHVIVHATSARAVGQLMQLPSGSVARQLNERKKHEGSVWEHPYQCTMIENGQHLLNCLRYVDLNMVRCGEVEHPSQWRWCGYEEITCTRKRYRLIDTVRLMESLSIDDSEDLVRCYSDGIKEQIARKQLTRQAHWTESLAVGSKQFIDKARTQYPHRRRFAETRVPGPSDGNLWTIRESRAAYTVSSGAKMQA